MLKRLPSRNQRSKGVRVKRVLQICVLIGVCFWLVYQIKHSHEKQKEFDESGSKISTENKTENLRLGRKDLPQENHTRNENSEETDDVEDEEEEQTKNDRSGIENENEDENEENDDDDVDNRMEKKDEDSFEENGREDSNDQTDTVDSSDHEAREEHYRGDDASSEVTHEGEDEEGQVLEEEAPDTTMDDNTHDGKETDDDGYNDDLAMVSSSKNFLHSALSSKQSNEHEGTENNDKNNNNVTVQADTESSNSSFVENDIEISDSSQRNSTEGSISDPGLAQNVTNSVDSENIRVEPNSTVSSETDYMDEVSEDKAVSNGTVQTEEREGSSEKLEETMDPTQPDLIDSTDTQISKEMSEARTDLETLPDFTKPQGNHNDNEEMAAE